MKTCSNNNGKFDKEFYEKLAEHIGIPYSELEVFNCVNNCSICGRHPFIEHGNKIYFFDRDEVKVYEVTKPSS